MTVDRHLAFRGFAQILAGDPVGPRVAARGEVVRRAVRVEAGDRAGVHLLDVDVAGQRVDRHRFRPRKAVDQAGVDDWMGRRRRRRLAEARIHRRHELRRGPRAHDVEVCLVGDSFRALQLLGADEVEGPLFPGKARAAGEGNRAAVRTPGDDVPVRGRRAAVVVAGIAVARGGDQARCRRPARADRHLVDVGA